MSNPNQEARDRHGRYEPNIDTADRDAEAARLRARGKPYREIAETLGMALSSAHDAVQRALKAARPEAGEDLQTLLLTRLDDELCMLDDLEAAARAVLERAHVTVSHGKVIYHGTEDGEQHPLLDDGPVLQAIDRLIRIGETRRRCDESRRKLLGLDAPSRVSIDAENLGAEIIAFVNAMTQDSDDAPAAS